MNQLNALSNRVEYYGKIQERYGIAKDQAKKDVDNWFNALKW